MARNIANIPQSGPSLHPYYGPWDEGLNLDLRTIGRMGPHSRVISAEAGPADADGSIDQPYSTASSGGAHPLEQALNDLATNDAPATGAEADVARIVYVLPGQYPALGVTIPAALPIVQIVCLGPVVFGSAANDHVWTRVAGALAGTLLGRSLTITSAAPPPDGMGEGVNIIGFQTLNVSDGGAGLAHTVQLRGVLQSGNVGVDAAGQTGDVTYQVSGGTHGGTWTVPQGQLSADGAVFTGAIAIERLEIVTGSSFEGNVTVTAVPTSGNAGIRRTIFDGGGGQTVTAVPGALLLDAFSFASLVGNGGSIAGLTPAEIVADLLEPPRLILEEVFDCVANTAVAVPLSIPRGTEIVLVSLTVAAPPASAAGTVLWTMTLNGTNLLAAANFDLETLVANTESVLALAPLQATRRSARGGLLLGTATSNNADMTDGTQVRLTIWGA